MAASTIRNVDIALKEKLQVRAARNRRSMEAELRHMEILGQGLGLYAEDLCKRLKLIGDIDAIIAETSPLIAAHNLDLDTVRDTRLQEFAAAQNCWRRRSKAGQGSDMRQIDTGSATT